jgi:hypothetical protein
MAVYGIMAVNNAKINFVIKITMSPCGQYFAGT